MKTHTPGISESRDLTKFRMVGILFSIAAGVWLAGCAGMERGRTKTAQPLRAGQIRVATCQFPVSHDIRENAEWIRRQVRAAAGKKADVVHFSECALSGYASKEWKTLAEFDYALQHHELESILELAGELQVWVVLGATHRLAGTHKPHNSLYIINAKGEIVDRYDKRFCTSSDLKHYSPGNHATVFEIHGVRCAALICYDVRFPELYRNYALQDVRLLFQSFHNASMKKTAVHPIIMPATLQAHAAMNNFFISANNSSRPEAWPSLFVTPDGLIQERLRKYRADLMVNLVDVNKKYYDASATYRKECIQGKWNSGEAIVNDPRSDDHRSY